MEMTQVQALFDMEAPFNDNTAAFQNRAALKLPECKVGAFLCPSRHIKGAINTAGQQPCDYVITAWQSNGGTDELMPCSNPGGHRGALQCAAATTMVAQAGYPNATTNPLNLMKSYQSRGGFETIIDGTSTTFMVAERHIDRRGLNVTGDRHSNNRDGTPFYVGGRSRCRLG